MISAGLDRAQLTVVLDVRHPLAYLALNPAIAFGRERKLAINWLPRANEPLRPPTTPAPDDDRGIRHRRHRARMIAREIAVYAELQGLTVNEPYRAAPADAANWAWLFVREFSPESLEPFLGEVFRRYWELGLDAGDIAAVSEVVGACGGDGVQFSEWATRNGSRAAEAIARELAGAGVFNVPAYLVADQVFYGRQHLPMIRWLLDGENGPIPI